MLRIKREVPLSGGRLKLEILDFSGVWVVPGSWETFETGRGTGEGGWGGKPPIFLKCFTAARNRLDLENPNFPS